MNFYTFIPRLLNMSLTASVAIVFVLMLRLLLKKAPKVISYALWGVVLFRLLCPVSIESGFSLFGLMDVPTADHANLTTSIEYVPENIVHTEYPAVTLPVPGVSDAINESLPSGREQLAADPLEAPVAIATYVWLAGVLIMAAYSVVSYRRLRQKLLTASLLRDNIYLADEITSPFVMGMIRPKIYLPSDMEEREQAYIILHEQYHIRRGDHIIKVLAFLALSIHWFNPLVWVAFIYSNKDMEMSCDEAVVKKMGEDILADYTASLLSLATGKRIIAGVPLAFGEGNTRERIRNLANWRKPAFWVVLVAVIACVMLAVGLLTNPEADDTPAPAEDGYFLLIGTDGVESIKITGPSTSGGVVNADDSFFKNGEKVWLEPLQGVADLRGYSITALGKNGEILYALSIPEDATKDDVINLVGSDGWLLAPAEFELSRDIGDTSQSAAPIESLNFEIDDVYFTYDSKRYDLTERNGMINEITDCFQIGKYLVLEGHAGPEHNVYCVFNMDTQTFEKNLSGANLTWYNNDINTAVYSYSSRVYAYDGRCLASYEFDESEYIYALEYTENGTQIHARIVSNEEDERTEIISPNAYIVSYSDLNHNRIEEQIVIRTVASGQVFELAVLENGKELWKTEAASAHTGWNTIMLYSEDGQDYLVQYNPSMFQGVGSYACTVFSLEDGKETVEKEWMVDFELPVKETPEMKQFAGEVGVLLRNCSVLLSTEQGMVVKQSTPAFVLPQLYPVRFNPDEIQNAIDGTKKVQELTSNAVQFPEEPIEFMFASGAGGWGTELTLNPDGSFAGSFTDSELGINAPEYPNGTRYVCEFEGQFSDIQQISDYSWFMKLTDLTTEAEPGQEWIEDGIRYVASGPYGIDGGEEFILCAPGALVDDLPGYCCYWWPDNGRWFRGEQETLSDWGLCNVNTEEGFFTTWVS